MLVRERFNHPFEPLFLEYLNEDHLGVKSPLDQEGIQAIAKTAQRSPSEIRQSVAELFIFHLGTASPLTAGVVKNLKTHPKLAYAFIEIITFNRKLREALIQKDETLFNRFHSEVSFDTDLQISEWYKRAMTRMCLLLPAPLYDFREHPHLDPIKADRAQTSTEKYNTLLVDSIKHCIEEDDTHIDTLYSCLTTPNAILDTCLLYTSPSPRDGLLSRMPSSA